LGLGRGISHFLTYPARMHDMHLELLTYAAGMHRRCLKNLGLVRGISHFLTYAAAMHDICLQFVDLCGRHAGHLPPIC
jgi:hypothetical protein